MGAEVAEDVAVAIGDGEARGVGVLSSKVEVASIFAVGLVVAIAFVVGVDTSSSGRAGDPPSVEITQMSAPVGTIKMSAPTNTSRATPAMANQGRASGPDLTFKPIWALIDAEHN